MSNWLDKYSEETPKAQKGKAIPATRQDSLDIRNSSLNFKKVAKKLGYVPSYTVPRHITEKNKALYEYKNNKISINKNIDDIGEFNENTNIRKNGDIYLNSNVFRKGGNKGSSVDSIGYGHPILKKEKDYQYSTTEQASFLGYNTDLPTILIDSRITPQMRTAYNLDNIKKTSDFAVFDEYDPIAVTPFDMLSEKEKAQRVKLYGRKGVPDSYEKQTQYNTQFPKTNVQSKGLVHPNFELETEVDIKVPVRIPKKYKIEDRANNPAGFGDGYGGNESSYISFDPSTLPKVDNRKITPIYQDGGWLGTYDNANESQVSLPPNYVGEGTSSQGRTYSPAWGGQFQDGGRITVPKTRSSEIKEHTSRLDYTMPASMRQRKDTPEEIARARKQRIQESVEARKVPYTKDNWRKQLAAETAATGDKMRISDTPNLFDDYINPAVWIGDMASNIGQAPYQAEQSNSNIPYLTSIGAPLAGGALGSLGTKTTGQFVNNIVNPLAGIVPETSSLNQYKLVTSHPWGTPQYKDAYRRKIELIDSPNIYKDIRNTEQNKFDKMLEALDAGEGWKFSKDDFAKAVEDANTASSQYYNYLSAEENAILTDPVYWENHNQNELVGFKGKKQGLEDLHNMAGAPEGEAWSLINASPGQHTVYKGDASVLSRLPHIKNEEQAIEATQKNLGRKFDKEMIPYTNKFTDLQRNQDGGIIDDDMGQWAHPGKITRINSNNITMQGVNYPVLGVSDSGDIQMMYPGKDYKFKGKKVTEYPMAQNGLRQEQKSLQNLDNLLNFTNYNTPQPGGWLDKY